MTSYACHNRPPFKRTLLAQDGYKPDGTRNMVEVPFRMSPLCEFTTTELGQVDERCGDCRHKTNKEQKHGC
jgi:hypothetical protein